MKISAQDDFSTVSHSTNTFFFYIEYDYDDIINIKSRIVQHSTKKCFEEFRKWLFQHFYYYNIWILFAFESNMLWQTIIFSNATIKMDEESEMTKMSLEFTYWRSNVRICSYRNILISCCWLLICLLSALATYLSLSVCIVCKFGEQTIYANVEWYVCKHFGRCRCRLRWSCKIVTAVLFINRW